MLATGATWVLNTGVESACGEAKMLNETAPDFLDVAMELVLVLFFALGLAHSLPVSQDRIISEPVRTVRVVGHFNHSHH